MKKILSILVCVCVLLSAMVITASAADTEIVFDFGAKGAAEHKDNNTALSASKSYTVDGYTLTITNPVKCYIDCFDAKGNSAIKLGTGSADGSFSITVPDDVTSVIFKVAQYKANATKVVVNDTTYNISTSSNDGAYTDVTVDTTATKSITFTATGSKHRCMIDSITYVIADTTGGNEPTCEHTAKSAVPNGDETHKLVCDACSETVTPVVECTDADINGKCDVCEGDVALPEAKTIAEVLAMADGDTKFYVTAEIVDTYRDTWATYGNFILKDDSTDETIILYGLHDEAGKQYDAMETKPVVGDTIKVLANRSSYKGVGQLANAVLIELIPATPDEGGDDVTPPAGDEGGDDVTPPAEDATLEVVDTPVAGTAYKFGMVQGNLDKTLYLTGEMDSFYYATTEDASAAADVYLEEADGGYNIYAMVNGAKKYLNIVEAMGSDGNMHTNAVFGDTAVSVYTYDETLATFVTAVGDKSYGFGTRNDREYTTISPCASTYVDNFFCKFYAEAKSDDTTGDDTTGGDSSTDGDNTTGSTTGGTTGGNAGNTDNSTTSPDTGDNMGAVVALAMVAGAALVFANKKR